MAFELPPIQTKGRQVLEVESPGLGLYLGRSGRDIPDGAMSACSNVRIRNGKVTNENVGYDRFFATALGGQVLLISRFVLSNGNVETIFGTGKDLFRYNAVGNVPVYITPIYATGTVTTVNGSPTITGSGTTWSTNLKAGDFIHVGSATQTAVSATWYEVQSVDSDTQITLTANYAGAGASGQAYTGRKTFTATNLDYWDADVFPDAPSGTTTTFGQGDRWIATNGSEIVAWDGSATQVQVLATATTGLQFTCKTVLYYKNMMLYGNLVESSIAKPSNFKNTAIGDPENVTTLEANEYTIADSVDFLHTLERLGDIVVGYCENSINVVQFVGNPVYFAIRTAGPSIGIFGPKCVANFGDYHEFLGKDQAYRFDGVRFIPYGNQVFDYILSIADRSRSNKAIAALSEKEREVYWVVPVSTDAGTDSDKSAEDAYVEHYAEPVGRNPVPFTKRDLPATAIGYYTAGSLGRFSDFVGSGFDDLPFRFNDQSFTSSLPALLFGDANGVVRQMDVQTKQDSSLVLACNFTTPERPLTRNEGRGIVRRVEPYIDKSPASGTLFVTVASRERTNGDVTNEVGFVEISHAGQRFASFRNPGRYAAVTFSTLFSDDPWVVDGYRVLVEELGDR